MVAFIYTQHRDVRAGADADVLEVQTLDSRQIVGL